MQSLTRTVPANAHNILTAQTPFVHPRGRDPFVAILIMDGDISAGGGGHVAPVNTLHGLHDLITGMKKRKVHVW
jgi:hypothetical protein